MSGRHYLDHASSSPLRPEAVDAICSWSASGTFADAGRQYGEGLVVRDGVEHARAAVAELFHVRPREIVFTSGGTEASNAASSGARAGHRGPIVCAAVEHSAVRLSSERSGPTQLLRVDGTARVDLDHLSQLLAGSGPEGPPALVHCQWANHEVGTVQPVAEVVERCHAHGVPVHVDACAAAAMVPLDLAFLGAELVSLSAHKLGGPPGIGALVVRRGTRIAPLLLGGDQERARRAGMENVPGILAFGAVATALARPGALEAAAATARAQTGRLLEHALEVEGVTAYGDQSNRLPHIACFGVPDVEAEAVVLGLDQAGVAVHSGSACSSESLEPSPVLEAMGVDARRSLRLSVGWSTTEEDIDAFARHFPNVVGRLRALAG